MHADRGQPALLENEAFQRLEWTAQRAAFVLFALVLIAAALGFFGGGHFSRAHVRSGAVSIDYERFLRRERGSTLAIRADAPAAQALTVEISGTLFEHSDVEAVSPRPIREDAAPDGVRYIFGVEAGEPARIILRVKPRRAGSMRGVVCVDGTSFSIVGLVYP